VPLCYETRDLAACDTSSVRGTCRWKEHCHKTFGYRVDDCPIDVIEWTRHGVGRNDCEMVADLSVIKNPLVRLYPIVVEHSASERVFEFRQCRFYRRDIIFRQRARIGTWISYGLVPLVQRLRDLQGALRGETEATVRFTLQAREIIQLRRDLRARLFFLQLDDAFFALALPLNRLGDFAMPQSGRSTVLVPDRPVSGIKPLLGIRQI